MNLHYKIEEEITVSLSQQKDSDKGHVRYYNLISTQYKLGPWKMIWPGPSWIQMVTFGPVVNRSPAIRGKYINIIINHNITNAKKHGYMTDFLVTRSPIAKIKKVGNSWHSDDGSIFYPIDQSISSFRDAMALIIGTGFTGLTTSTSSTQQAPDDQVIFDINKRFQIMSHLVKMIGNKKLPGMIVSGTGGLGKTYTITSTLEEMGITRGNGYEYYQGAKMTPTEFYKICHDNRDSLLLFDDCDSFLQDEVMINMLKSGLDTSGTRSMSYYSPKIEAMGLEPSFVFTGQMIIITNLTEAQISQPIRSRSVYVDVTMTRSEIIERMKYIVSRGIPKGADCTLTAIHTAMNFIEKFIAGPGSHTGRPRDLNMRTLIKVARMYDADPENFNDIATYTLLVS